MTAIKAAILEVKKIKKHRDYKVANLFQVQAIHNILSNSRLPVPRSRLMGNLECSDSTIGRIISYMKQSHGAPIEYDRKLLGYFYNNKNGEVFELPGLWFNESELYALLVSQKLLLDVHPGLFSTHIQPLLSKIENILHNSQHHPDEIATKVKILHQAHRIINNQIFQKLAKGLMENRQLNIHFYNRATNATAPRNVSPLRLVFYRDNWYLDAWCGTRKDFRTFSVINIKQTTVLNDTAQAFDESVLDNYYASAYGIFSGEANNTAVLRFNSYRARWVADESWHPQQKSQWLDNGDYELHIPYSDHRELIMDILKYGADVTVISPPSLVKEVKAQLTNNLKNYQ